MSSFKTLISDALKSLTFKKYLDIGKETEKKFT